MKQRHARGVGLRIFTGKIAEKATWSRGFFISHSGFTEDTPQVFSKPFADHDQQNTGTSAGFTLAIDPFGLSQMIRSTRQSAGMAPVFMEFVNHLNRESSFLFSTSVARGGEPGRVAESLCFRPSNSIWAFGTRWAPARRWGGAHLRKLPSGQRGRQSDRLPQYRFRLPDKILFDLANGRCEVVIVSDGSGIFRHTRSGSIA